MENFHCLANKNKIDRIQSYVLIEIVNILKNKYNVSFIDAVTFMIELYTLKYIQCSVHINLDVDVDVQGKVQDSICITYMYEIYKQRDMYEYYCDIQ